MKKQIAKIEQEKLVKPKVIFPAWGPLKLDDIVAIAKEVFPHKKVTLEWRRVDKYRDCYELMEI